jgi:hypothetical protein
MKAFSKPPKQSSNAGIVALVNSHKEAMEILETLHEIFQIAFVFPSPGH